MFRNPAVDLVVVLVIVLLIFGPKRLPDLGRSLGQGLKEFKDGITGGDSKNSEDADRPELPPASAAAAAPTDSARPASAPSPEAEVGSERRS